MISSLFYPFDKYNIYFLIYKRKHKNFMATQSVRIGWRPYVNVVTQVVNAVDADATAFITAAGITNLTQASAINTLVNDLKTYGLWTKMKALYPFVGGSATSHKFNLKDPRDLDAAYRLVFNGGWTHTSTGALPNGSNGFADTKLLPYSVLTSNNNHLSLYSNLATITDSSGEEANIIGVVNSAYTQRFDLAISSKDAFATPNTTFTTNNNSVTQISYVDPSKSGYYISNRTTNNNFKLFKNNSVVGSNTNTNTSQLPNFAVYIGGWNVSGATRYAYRRIAFGSIGDGLTDAESTAFYTAVQKFQTTLGRQIGSPIVSDTDAQAFINAAGLTDLGQANAVNTLVVDLKAAGVWTKMKALYPMVGGSATSHKWNLKDPRDLDAAFRLVFNGGWVHTSTGAKPNGTTGYANTYFNPTVQSLSTTSQHLSYYSRTNIIENAVELGAISSANVNFLGLYVSSTSGTRAGLASSARYNNSAVVDTRGLFIASRTDTSNIKVHVNGSVQASQSVPSTGNDNFSMYIGAYGALTPDLFSTKETAFASIGDGLTDTEASAFYTAVQKYQTSLGRQIGTPVLASGQTAGLLDTYSSAAAAYSLRKLRNGYVGNAIRVRRSSDNAEQDIAFKTDGTLDTTSLLAFVGSGNGFVTIWYDQSGNTNNIRQTVAANQPRIVVSGNILLDNGKPTIKFGTSNDSWPPNGTSTFLTFPATFLANSPSPIHMFNVWKITDWGNSNGGIFGSTNGFGKGLEIAQTSVISRRSLLRINNYIKNDNAAETYQLWNNAQQSLTTINILQNSVSAFKNGNGVLLTNSNGIQNLENNNDTYSIGLYAGTYPGYMNQQELIFFTSDKSTERTNIESNINSYYSIY